MGVFTMLSAGKVRRRGCIHYSSVYWEFFMTVFCMNRKVS